MQIPQLIILLTNRIAHLEGQKSTAESRGDVPEVLRLGMELDETRATLATLKAA